MIRNDLTPLTTLFQPAQLPALQTEPHLMWLGTRIVQLVGGSYLVRQHDDSWLELGKATMAAANAQSLWLGYQQYTAPSGQILPVHIDADTIIGFLLAGKPAGSKAIVPIVSGDMMIPGCEALAVEFEGHRFINTWHDTLMAGDEQALNDPRTRQDLETLLRMIREGLCGMDDVRSLHDMMNMLHAKQDGEEVFRFTMNWLAAPFQQPGLNLGTNLWQLGPLQGIGKGTLQRVMARLYGGDLVLTMNMSELHRGWTDQLVGRLLVCMNEIGESRAKPGDMDLMDFTKQYANEDKVTFAKRYRGIGKGGVPNFTNYCGTGNNLQPIARVDPSDRRHAFHQTNQNPEKVRYGAAMFDVFEGSADRLLAVLEAFAFVLRSLDIEHDLIKRPLPTALRALNVAASETEESYWLENDEAKPLDEWVLPGKVVPCWNNFFELTERKLNAQEMGRKLRRLHAMGLIEMEERPRCGTAKARKVAVFRISSQRYPRGDAACASGTTKAKADALHRLKSKAVAAPVLFLGPPELQHAHEFI